MKTHPKKAATPETENIRHLLHAADKNTNQIWQTTRTAHQTHFMHKSTIVINAKKHWTPVQAIKHH